MSFLFGYYDLGLRALSSARIGLQVAGDNIANATTPGYSRRRVELSSGFPFRVPGGYVSSGGQATITRAADRFLQASLEREKGNMAGSRELLRGLRELETSYGSLGGEGVASAYADFSNRFAELSGQPDSSNLRRAAITSAETLASQIRDAYVRLENQQRTENGTIAAVVDEVNRLAEELAHVNDEIVGLEADGSVAGPLRDQRGQIVERLSELTGGSTFVGEQNRLGFSLPGGPTLVTGSSAIRLETSQDAAGLLQVSSAGIDLTDRLRQGELGGLIAIRDDHVPEHLAALDTLAADLITRANALTAAATDLNGDPGGPLFEPDPPPATGAARSIAVHADLIADQRKLAVSLDGTPGDPATALAISKIRGTASAALGNATPADFLAEAVTRVGSAIVQADVAASVTEELVASLEERRDAVSGVSLDEEAVELLRHQQAFEAATRFMQVLNEVTELTLSIAAR